MKYEDQYARFHNMVEIDSDPLNQRPGTLTYSLNGRIHHFEDEENRWENVPGNVAEFTLSNQAMSYVWCIEKAEDPAGSPTPISFDFSFTLHDLTVVNLTANFNDNDDADTIMGAIKAQIDGNGTLTGTYNISTSLVDPGGTDYSLSNDAERACFVITGDSNGDRFTITHDQLSGTDNPTPILRVYFAGFKGADLEVLGHATIDNSLFIITTDDNSVSGGHGQIWEISFVNKSYDSHTLLYSKDMSVSMKYQIQAFARFRTAGQRTLYWTDNYNVPRAMDIDIDELPLKNVDFLNLSPAAKVRKIDLVSMNDGGGILKTGSYQFSAQYIDQNGNGSNFFPVTNAIPVIDEANTAPASDRDGAAANTTTTKSITLKIDDLDVDYSKIKFVVIKHVNSIIETFSFGEVDIVNSSVQITYTGTEPEVAVDFSEVDNKQVFINRLGTISHKDGRFIGGDVGLAPDLAYQQYANAITAEPIIIQQPGWWDYKNERAVLNDKGFPREEVIPFGIVFYFKDGGRSFVYHIPGTDDVVASRVYTSGLFYPTDPALGYPSGRIKHHQMPSYVDTDADWRPIAWVSGAAQRKILGRRFKNIQIPAEIRDRVVGFSIVRGKRSYPNRRNIASGIIYPCFEDGAGTVRIRPTAMFGLHTMPVNGTKDIVCMHSADFDFGFHDYEYSSGDKMLVWAAAYGDITAHVAGPGGSFSCEYGQYEGTLLTQPINITRTLSGFKIMDPLAIELIGTQTLEVYNLPLGYASGGTSVRHPRAAFFQVDTPLDDPNYTIHQATAGAQGTLGQPYPLNGERSWKYMATLLREAGQFHGEVGNIEYESIGHFYPVDDNTPSTIAQIDVYGGDAFISRYDHRRQLRWDGTTDDAHITSWAETEMNVQYRHGDYAPKIPVYSASGSTELTRNQEYNERNYNIEYSVLNNQETLAPRPNNFVLQNEFPTMIIYSAQSIAGEISDAYRVFRANDIAQLPQEYGKIMRVDTLREGFYVFQRRAFAKLPVNPRSFIPQEDTDVIEITSGTNVLSKEHYISTAYGLTHRFGLTKSDKAFYFIDAYNNIFFRFAQDGLRPISKQKKWDQWMRNNLRGGVFDTDNPLNDIGIRAYYDFNRDEVWFTFFDFYVIAGPTDVYTARTIVYKEGEKDQGFLGEFSATPYDAVSHLGNFFTWSKQSPAGLLTTWHHSDAADPGNFYGTVFKSEFEYIVNKYPGIAKVLDVLRLNMISENDTFFDTVLFTNEKQTHTITFAGFNRLIRKESLWRFPAGKNDADEQRLRDLYHRVRFTIDNTSTDLVKVMAVQNRFRNSYI